MKKHISLFMIFTLILSLVVIGVGCGDQKEEAGVSEDVSDFDGQISFNGSSTLAPVISAIGDEFSEEFKTWDKVDASLPKKEISIYVSSGGSSAGIKSIMEGTSDFGMLAREVKDEEREQIKDMKEYKLGLDALTISINPENPLAEIKDNLTTEEVRDIFSGKYKYWDEIDDNLPHREIVVVIRDVGGGAHEVFQKTVLGELDVREDAIQAPSMGALVTKVIENKDAIGYASYGMVNQNKGKILPLKVDGIEPTKENIQNGSYKISRPLIVVKKGELAPWEKAFMDRVLSDKGMEVVEKMGFVPME